MRTVEKEKKKVNEPRMCHTHANEIRVHCVTVTQISTENFGQEVKLMIV